MLGLRGWNLRVGGIGCVYHLYCWYLRCCWFWRVHFMRCGSVLCRRIRLVFVLRGGQLFSCWICGMYHLFWRYLCCQLSRHLRALCFRFILRRRRCGLHIVCGRHVVARPR